MFLVYNHVSLGLPLHETFVFNNVTATVNVLTSSEGSSQQPTVSMSLVPQHEGDASVKQWVFLRMEWKYFPDSDGFMALGTFNMDLEEVLRSM
jgi:hypothetical protein